VLNATGILVHTNLGRAPLAAGAARSVLAAATGYTDLELDLATGERGSRGAHVEPLLRELSGAEAALVVNNNAGALLLALDTLARGREVVISRGELVEIGGSFRLPEIIERTGARLREVGTTNRTHPRDYENAIGPETALLLKVHRSNFRMEGFTRSVPEGDLAPIARRAGVPLVVDAGSGLFSICDPGVCPRTRRCRPCSEPAPTLCCFRGTSSWGARRPASCSGVAIRSIA
jgi:L-seryl-tRNA(Ser) seleniumtransferase